MNSRTQGQRGSLGTVQILCAVAVAAFVPYVAHGQVVATVLHQFESFPLGMSPTGVIRDAGGNFYGTATSGGDSDQGVVFKVDPAGNGSVLHSFTGGADGGRPNGGMTFDSAGNLYGTNQTGGSGGFGVVFKIDTANNFTALYNFTAGVDGHGSTSGLVADSGGNLYGTAYSGASSIVFKISPGGEETTLATLSGASYLSTLILDSAGNLYGTAARTSGANPDGIVFKVSPAGAVTVVHSFQGGAGGKTPGFGVSIDASGNLYGTADGGTKKHGIVFKLDTSNSLSVVYTFTRTGSPSSTALVDSVGDIYATHGLDLYKISPAGKVSLYGLKGGSNGNLTLDASGDVYGATFSGGVAAGGSIYKFSTSHHLTTVFTFPAGPDGAGAYSGVTLDSAGNIYGTTEVGGTNNLGVVYKLDPSGNETILYNFSQGGDGVSVPPSRVAFDSAGNIYGATGSAGNTGEPGAIYKIDTTGHVSMLYSFMDGADGGSPESVIADGAGNLYGTAQGGAGHGVVFKVNPAGNETVLHTFTGTDGSNPAPGLVLDGSGNLYGATTWGGVQGTGCSEIYASCGVIFKIDASGDFSVLYSFGGLPDAFWPLGNLVMDSSGNLYGTTDYGGTGACPEGCGTIFKIDPSGNESLLYSFPNTERGPVGGLALDSTGNLYGIIGGGAGSVLSQVTPEGQETNLYSYSSPLPTYLSGLTMDAVGNLYGSGAWGGAHNGGAVYEISGAAEAAKKRQQ